MYDKLKLQYPEIPVGRAKNLIGNKYGKWTVLYRIQNPDTTKTRTYWLCQCECGTIKPVDAISLTNHRSFSCGCSLLDKKKNFLDDQIGKKIGHWTIIGPGSTNRTFICECDCEAHTRKEMRKDSMKTSLGCEVCSSAVNKLQNLIGKKFGHWTVLEKRPRQGCHIMWLCECDCEAHTKKEIDGYKLRSGKTLSCGCDSYSNGERAIAYLLDKNGFSYEQEKSFDTCKIKSHGKPRFDFYVENQYLIEFDGEQHFILRENGWNNPEKLKDTQARDAYKTQWCKDNNIPLIRIPYWHLKELKLEDLLLETSKFIIGE